MAEPGQAATPDELAAVFLRARDVPCPKCGYNRRDGTTAACPECHTSLSLNPTPRGIPRTAALLIVVAFLVLGADLAWSLMYTAIGFRHDLEVSSHPALLILRVAGAILLPTAAAVLGIRALLASDHKRRTRFWILAAMIFLTHKLIEHAWAIPGRIQYIQDRLDPAIIWD